ncbi:MAG: hypothetical protein ACLQBK_00345 [Candidatus Sulfotelmatobacter sp.]
MTVGIEMTAGKGKRSRDPNELAKWIVEQSASETPEPEIVTVPVSPPRLSRHMAEIGRKGGQIGGKRRLKTMTKEQRRKVAAKAARSMGKERRRPKMAKLGSGAV